MSKSQDEMKKPVNPVGRPTKYKKEYCDMLIGHMKSGLSYETFGASIDVDRATVYNWEKSNPEFLDAKKRAFDQCQLYWEKAGNAGLYMGGKDNPFNATVWIFNMKNRFNWMDKKEQTHSISEETKKLVIDMGD
jgi:hypothetical protein